MRRETAQNVIVSLISLGGALLCAALFYKDIYGHNAADGDRAVAGRLAEKVHSVKRKLSDTLLWDPLNVHESLYWNDSVQTAARGRAEIELEDGNTISLGPAALVVLEKDNDQLALNLKSGQVIVKTARTAGKKAIKVNGAKIEQNGGDELSISANDAQGKVTATASGSDGTVKQVTVDPAGHAEEKTVPISLTDPAPLARQFTESADAGVELKWDTKESGKQIVEVARDAAFKDIVVQKEAGGGSEKLKLNPGQYFWRLKLFRNGEPVASESRSFDVIQTAPPPAATLKAPDKVVYASDAPSVEFKWQGDAAANGYIFEVSDSPDFKNVVFTRETNNAYLRTSELKPGKFFWRVKALYGDRVAPSQPVSISVEKSSSVHPPAELGPDKDFKADYGFFEAHGGLPFHWKGDAGSTFRFVLSHSADLSDPLVSFETTRTDTEVKDRLAKGTYYWTVAYKDADGKWTMPEPRKIEVGPLTPPPRAPAAAGPDENADLDLLKNPKLVWTWKEVGGAKEYHFRLAKLGDGKEDVVLEDRLNSLSKEKTDLPDGKYKWSVSSVDEFGRESAPSAREFKVYHGKTLDAPDFDMSEVQ